MAARNRKIRHDDETRAKIQAALLIDRMMQCVTGKVVLDAQQVSCAKALLAKVLPDLSAVEHSGEVGSFVADVPKVEETSDEWASGNPTLQ